MTGTAQDHLQAVEALQAPTAVARRAAAKRIRRLKDPSIGPALIDALRREMLDPEAWETQYHLVMALAEAGYEPALPCLRDLARQEFAATMLYVALGDAIVRLGRSSENDPTPVLELMSTSNSMLIDGAFRAMAMLHLKPNPEAIEQMVNNVSRLDLDDELRFWVAAAAAGWSGPTVERFLAECAASPREDVENSSPIIPTGEIPSLAAVVGSTFCGKTISSRAAKAAVSRLVSLSQRHEVRRRQPTDSE